jgi:hypothetical protein
MTDRTVMGVRPSLPGALGRWRWLNEPVPAERLAALRIGVGLVLMADILLTYLPFRHDFFGPGSLAEPDVFEGLFTGGRWGWSLIRWFPAVYGRHYLWNLDPGRCGTDNGDLSSRRRRSGVGDGSFSEQLQRVSSQLR